MGENDQTYRIPNWDWPGDEVEEHFKFHTMPDHWGGLASAYKDSGDVIIDAFKQTRGAHRDLLVTALFCYRQYFELTIKHIASRLNYHLSGEETPYRTIHNLEDLWSDMERAAKELMGDNLFTDEDDERMFRKVKSCVADLNWLDPRGTGFRYPNDIAIFYVAPFHLKRGIAAADTYLGAFFDYCTAGQN